MSQVRTKGIDLDDIIAAQTFDAAIPRGGCSATELFKLGKVTEAATTSEWRTVVRWQNAINLFLEASEGRIPKQKSLHRQFQTWLKKEKLNWASKDSERAIFHFRIYKGVTGLLQMGS
jgi:hypothetical protein